MKYLIMLTVFFILNTNLYSQFGCMYVKTSYNFPALKSNLNEYYNHIKSTNGNYYVDQFPAVSFGDGTMISAGIENFFDNNIGFDFNIAYKSKSKTKYNQETVIMSVKKSTKSIVQASYWGLTPSMVLYNNYGNLYFSLKTGLLFAIPNIEVTDNILIDTSETNEIWAYKSPLSFGLNSSISASFLVKDKYLISLSCSFVALKSAPNSASVTFAQNNGKNILRNLQIYYKEKEFVDEIDLEYNLNPDYDKPKQLIRDYYSFSSFDISLTLAYLLWKD